MRLIKSTPKGKKRVYDIEVADVHNFYANGINVHNCATNGGVSVIKDDGNVYDFTFSGQNGSKVWEITFDENYQICMLLGYSNVYPYTSYIHEVPSADKSLSATTDRVLNNNTYNFPSDAYKADNTPGDFITAYIDSKYFGTTHGMSFLTPNKNGIGGQLIAHMNTSFNSGWMHGDIKGAFLADTDDTDVTGSELITNGTFDTDSDWVIAPEYPTSQYTISGGTLRVDSGTTYGEVRSQNSITLEVGKKYVFSANVIGHSGNYYLMLASSATDDDPNRTGYNPTSGTGIKSFYFTAPATTMWFYVATSAAASDYVEIDNLSLRLVEEDRSVNNKGLQVFGTITKSVVSPGAELIGYSGFSSTNKLIQPYNSSMNYGTNDLYIMLWAKHIPNGSNIAYYLFDRSDSDATNRLGAYYIPSSNRIDIFAPSQTLNASGLVPSLAEWSHIAFVRQNSTGYLYINGNLIKSQSGMTEDLTGDGTAELRIGARYNGAEPWTIGNLALFRTGASAPSPEQIKKIYEDEKVLFQENAACTLYGSSDAVTALAYDEDLQLLHVGTSSGRSDFQGLRRINNTTTAVATAISASNGLVAEQ